jgi:hypothetical protein
LKEQRQVCSGFARKTQGENMMLIGRSFTFAGAASIGILAVGQVAAAPAHSTAFSAAGAPLSRASSTGTVHVPHFKAMRGDYFWLTPNCPQPNVPMQTDRGIVWEYKSECSN